MLLATLLHLAMITQTDVANLRSAKLSPNAVNNIAATAGTRSVVLAKANFSTYSGPTGTQTVLSYLIPANTLEIGDCFRWELGGYGANADVAPRNFTGAILISQTGSTSYSGAAPVSVPNAAAGQNFMWRSSGMVCVGIAGATGQYLAGGGSNLSTTYTANPRANSKLPTSALGLSGYSETFVTTTSAGISAVGTFLAASSGQSIISQVTFSANQPILIQLNVQSLGTSNTSLTVTAGYLEGL